MKVNTKIKIDIKWDVQFKKAVYSCSLSDILGDSEPEIIACCFDGTMKIFNQQAKQLMVSEFSSKITTFLVASVINELNPELLSGDINGVVRLLGKKGDLIWSTDLKSPIICSDIGDFNGNGNNEVVLGLQNNKIIFLDKEGQIIESFEAPDEIRDCTMTGEIDNFLGRLLILLKNGMIINFDKNGRSQEIFQLDGDPTVIRYNILCGIQVLIIGYKSGILRLADFEGNIIGEIILNDKIRCINRYIPNNNNKFITVAAGNSLYFLELFKTNTKLDGKKLIPVEKQEIVLKTEPTIETPQIDEKKVILEKIADKPSKVINSKGQFEREGIKIQRGSQIEGSKFIFKIKLINEREYNITDVNIQILSYPEESLSLIREKEGFEYRTTSPDRVKIHKVTKGGFVSPKFTFLPRSDCIKGLIRVVINFLNESDEIETMIMQPYEIKVICGLLQPNPITVEEFDKFSQDLINFQKVGEEVEVLIEAGQLYEKLLVILETKNFFIVDMEKQAIGDKLFGLIKAFAKGKYSENKFGLQITLTGVKNSNKSLLKIDTFSQDIDMNPAVIYEIEHSIVPKTCSECNYDIPPELLQRILKGKKSYCENCGAVITY